MEDFNSIKEDLRNANAEIRRLGIEKVGECKTEEALVLLFEAIGDADWRVRKTAVDALLRFSNFDNFYKEVFSALEVEDNAGKRNAAVEIITKLGEKAVGHITEFLFHANYEVKKFLIDALGDIKNASSANAVAELLNDSDENVRSSAAETLGKIKDKGSVQRLINVLGKDDLQLQFCALEALESIGEPVDINVIAPLLEKKILRKAAYEVLGKSKDAKAIKYLASGIDDSSKASRETAINAIVNIYNAISDEKSKQSIVELLSKISTPELIEKLTVSLSSSRKEAQKGVISLLGLLKEKGAHTIPKMLDIATDDELRERVFNSIILMGSAAYEVLKEEFISRGDEDKRFLAQIMGKLKDERYGELLAESLKSKFGHLRSACALSMAQINQIDSIKQIFPLFSDPYKDVQASALEALTTLGQSYPKEIRGEIESRLNTNDDQLKINIISLIGRIGIKEDIKHLDTALRDGNPEVRTAAVYAIGAINVLAESKHLILTLTDESDTVRIATAKTLGLLYSEESFKALLMALEDDNLWVKINAMRSLAKLNANDAIEQIKQFLKNSNPLLVINAIESLKELGAPRLKECLFDLLTHEDAEVVKSAINILKEGLDDAATSKILTLLNSDDPQIRILVYKSMENVKDETIKKRLLPFVENEKDEMIKRMAKRILDI